MDEAGFINRHRLIEGSDHLAVPKLVHDGGRFDLAFIDGWYSFDYVILDSVLRRSYFLPRRRSCFDDCDVPGTVERIGAMKSSGGTAP